MSLLIVAGTLLMIWLIGREKPPYSKTYHHTRLTGTFSTSYEAWFDRYLDHVSEEIEARLQVGPISPRDDLHAHLYHPELAVSWQKVRDGVHVRRTIAGVLSAGLTLSLADSVSRVLTNGNGLFHGFGTTGLDLRQLFALAFALTALVLLTRLRNSKMQTQGYLDGYSDGYLQLKSKREWTQHSYKRATRVKEVAKDPTAAELVAWMPAFEAGSPRFVNPWKEARQIVGAVHGVKGQSLDRDVYLILLADRFDRMLAAEDSPEYALEEAFSWLESEGLAENCPDSLEQAGRHLIVDNPFIQERLYLMGIPGHIPELTNTDARADKVLRETSLTQWVVALCNKHSDSQIGNLDPP